MYTFEALQIFIFLIPGFMAASILDMMVPKKETKELGRVVEALIFSMIIYTIYASIFKSGPVAINKSDGLIVYSFNASALICLFGISLIMPIVFSYFIVHDWHMTLLRKMRATSRTARNCVWHDAFSKFKKHIIINFKNGRRIYGWPEYYSDDSKDGFIFLSNAAWINEKGEFDNLDLEGILITPEQKIESIEFTKSYKQEDREDV